MLLALPNFQWREIPRPSQIQCCQDQSSFQSLVLSGEVGTWCAVTFVLGQLDIVFGNPTIFVNSPSSENHGLCVFVGLTHNLDEDWAWDRTCSGPRGSCSIQLAPWHCFSVFFQTWIHSQWKFAKQHWVMEAETICCKKFQTWLRQLLKVTIKQLHHFLQLSVFSCSKWKLRKQRACEGPSGALGQAPDSGEKELSSLPTFP